ncbi:MULTISPECIES: hypothetical protein [unclassified Ensifer]|uniref:hypothetical protein n=1 Tax=unclassified Ensifer TaxID=2633371 RepID=UPI00070AE100|nr:MULTISPECIES: hypothetical protein [unclassified Ensifer]KQW33608.1 hypothetical protein ASD02_19440 [Ensifer sp. Root1252]KQW56867.1 hypothetical protein ASD03_16630 [Ensifer sp. Root127]KRC78782.1 hypothetical protein ASE32_27410 [Ensifer sp. Root231]KRD02685.1 hypothetical protein ASE47_20500 [Ensifer sp. Root258]
MTTTQVVVFGVEGDDGLWLADLGTGTVSRIVDPLTGALASANEHRNAGATVVKGVNLAVRANSAGSVSGGFMDG